MNSNSSYLSLPLLRHHTLNFFCLFVCIFLLQFFGFCKDMSPSLTFPVISYRIKENQPAGLIVGNLFDTLRLKSYFISARSKFTLQNTNSEYFSLKPESSMLITNKLIDVDSMCSADCSNGSKEFKLIAIIWQNNHFLQEVKISVFVEDINDNDPIFKSNSYQKSIKEIIYGPGKYIELPRAYDKDISLLNSAIFYSLAENSSMFNLTISKDGHPKLQILQYLDAEVQDDYKVVLLAGNLNFPERPSASLSVTIFIEDINDNEPKFSQSIYKVPIPENVELNHSILHLKATDKDKSSKLNFLLLPGTSYHISQTFHVSRNGVITLLKHLDYEKQKQYQIPVRVTDGEFSSNAVVEVIVIDVNDCPPEFSLNPEQLKVYENTVEGHILGQISVYDRDSTYVDKGIQCSERSSNQAIRFDKPNTSSGRSIKLNMYLNQILDRDIPDGDKRTSVLVCNDMGMGGELTSSFTITLTVLDKNDNPPVFRNQKYNIRIRENLRAPYPIAEVSAIDKDSGINAEISYYLPDNGYQHMFRIDQNSGQITVLKSLDREEKDYYQFAVIAHDMAINESRLTSTTTVNVNVSDVNDCVPKINELSTVLEVSENKPVGTHIGNLTAVDCDVGLNGKFVFILIPSAYSNYFELYTNGSLYTKTVFDREKLTQVKFCLRVTVRDLGEEIYLSSRSVVCIRILDENDNPPEISINPEFIRPSNITDNRTCDFSITASKYDPPQSPIIQFSYSDLDDGINAIVSFNLQSEPSDDDLDPLFQMNSTQGLIRLRRQWRQSDNIKYLLILTAVDGGMPNLKSSKTILVFFSNVPARFKDSEITTASLGNLKINIFIIIILVTISTLLTTALVGAIVCMMKPCGTRFRNTNNNSTLIRDLDDNHNFRIKDCSEALMMTNSIIGSLDNEMADLKQNINIQENSYCQSEHHWTHKIDDTGRDLKYFTLPPQLLPCAVTTTHEEQRSDSGRGASDEDNPVYISTTDLFQQKPLYSLIPNIRCTSLADPINISSATVPVSLTNKTLLATIPSELLTSTIDSAAVSSSIHMSPEISCSRNCRLLVSSTLPSRSGHFVQNFSILPTSVSTIPESDVYIPLLFPHSASPHESSSCYDENSLKASSPISLPQQLTLDEDMANLSSHIDQLFFTKRPLRLKSYGKS